MTTIDTLFEGVCSNVSCLLKDSDARPVKVDEMAKGTYVVAGNSPVINVIDVFDSNDNRMRAMVSTHNIKEMKGRYILATCYNEGEGVLTINHSLFRSTRIFSVDKGKLEDAGYDL